MRRKLSALPDPCRANGLLGESLTEVQTSLQEFWKILEQNRGHSRARRVIRKKPVRREISPEYAGYIDEVRDKLDRCAPKKLRKATRVHDLRCQWFQAIFVMQPRQDRSGNDLVAIRDSVPIWSREPAACSGPS